MLCKMTILLADTDLVFGINRRSISKADNKPTDFVKTDTSAFWKADNYRFSAFTTIQPDDAV